MPPEVQVWEKQPAREVGPMNLCPENWISNPWTFTNTASLTRGYLIYRVRG